MMKNTGQTLINLRALIKDTLISTEQAARTSKDFVDIQALSALIEQIGNDITFANRRILDLSIETIDKQSISMSHQKAEGLVKERIQTWKS